ncbi:MAG TPA: hypothetical protein PLV05_01350 [Verrucomicrobiota bacterium]|nr:hypothetical protein [Verrucomicrobiota bacterium]HRR63632.1 hypothetical protein [Candidatus Paceibacterota bacterium]NLH84168.1 hypothetical protein [Verrucomicrobiota bacterium]HNR70254.1 hypothetical protein [Verrucomicrobiota bacterium]HOF69777.1 hypothetical protein [Verrucomicrobiota bacterium]
MTKTAISASLNARMKKKPSRQYRWQQKQIALNRCARCGAERTHYAILCDACHIADRIRQQERSGSRPWQKGKRGRPPIVPLPEKKAALL